MITEKLAILVPNEQGFATVELLLRSTLDGLEKASVLDLTNVEPATSFRPRAQP
jgi:hypothetical protein